jgi:hypothetical protein
MMKTTPEPDSRRGIVSLRLLACVAGVLLLVPLALYSTPPAWWTEREVIDTTRTPNDYGPANAGQLKNIATKAAAELEAHMTGTEAVSGTVASFSGTNNYTPINLGQLKAVAKPFYDVLIDMDYCTGYPWTITTGTVNLSPANIGQVKNVFSFDPHKDANGNGIPDWVEAHYGILSITQDTDGNGLPDWWERFFLPGQTDIDPGTLTIGGMVYVDAAARGFDPTKPDNDGDGVNDGADLYPGDPNRSEDVAVTPLAALDISGTSTGGQNVQTVALNDNGDAAFWNYTESGTTADYHVVWWQNGAIKAEGVLPHKIEYDDPYGWHCKYEIQAPVGVSAVGVVACNGSITKKKAGYDDIGYGGYFTWNVYGGSAGSGGTGNMPTLITGPIFNLPYYPSGPVDIGITADGITAEGVVWGHKRVRFYHCSRGLNVDFGQVTFIGAMEFPQIDVDFDDDPYTPKTTVYVHVVHGRFAEQSVSTSGSRAAGIYTPPAAVSSKDVVLTWNTSETIPIDDLLDETQNTFKVWTGEEGAGAFQDAFPGHVPDTATHAVATNNDGVTVGTSPHVSGTTSETGFIWQGGGSGQRIVDILPEANRKQIRGITPLLLSNAGGDGYNLKFTADNLEGPEDAPQWVSRTMMLSSGASSSGSDARVSVQQLPEQVSTSGDPLNSHRICAAIGTITTDSGGSSATSATSAPKALGIAPLEVVADTNNNYQVDSTDKVLTYVRFGLWDNAFDTSTPANVLNGNDESANFVGRDSRRFYLRVCDPSATSQTVTAHWFTQKAGGSDDDHPATDTVTLTETAAGSGIFVSKALMLVTDEVDNNQPTKTGLPGGGNAAKGAADHRLRHAALGGKMCFSYTPAAAGSPRTTVSLPLFNPAGGEDGVKTMTVQIANMFGGNPSTGWRNANDIPAIEQNVAARLAVAGVKADFKYQHGSDCIHVDPTTNINLNDVEAQTAFASGVEGRIAALVKSHYAGADPHTVFLILIQQFQSYVVVGGATAQEQGEAYGDGAVAFHPPYGPSRRCSFVATQGLGASSSITCVPAHELGHQLGCQVATDNADENHYSGAQQDENLMKKGAEDPYPGHSNSPRRLWNDTGHPFLSHPKQIEYMRTSPLLKATTTSP